MTRNQVWHQDSQGIVDNAEIFDLFGWQLIAADFNDDKIDDLAISVFGESVGNITNAGAVNVIYGSNSGLTATNNQVWHQNSLGINGEAEDGDNFGTSLTAADFDGDGIADLAVSAFGEDIGNVQDGGSVNAIYGSNSGLAATDSQLWTQNSPGISGNAEDFDNFGASLVAGDFNGDGLGDLAISAASEGVGDIESAGAVNIIYGSSSGLTATDSQVWTQNSPGISGDAEELDLFGTDLSAGDFNGDGIADLAISSANEGVGDIESAGAVNIIYGSSSGLTATDSQLWTQNSSGISGSAEELDLFGTSLTAGDFNGDKIKDLAIAAANEDLGDIEGAGAVNIIYGSSSGLTATDSQVWTQNSPGISGDAEDFDNFGASLAAADFNGDGIEDLAVGSPNESVGDLQFAGTVNIIYGSDTGLAATDNQVWTQNSPGISGEVEDFDNFGASLTTGDFNGDGFADLAIGVAGENIGNVELAGAVQILYGSASGLTAL
ncbi:MAG: hypothetical protein Tsb0014_14040 [Pleurocapsa sp.]